MHEDKIIFLACALLNSVSLVENSASQVNKIKFLYSSQSNSLVLVYCKKFPIIAYSCFQFIYSTLILFYSIMLLDD